MYKNTCFIMFFHRHKFAVVDIFDFGVSNPKHENKANLNCKDTIQIFEMNLNEEVFQQLREYIVAEIGHQFSSFAEQLQRECSRTIDEAIDQKIFKRRKVVDVLYSNA